MAGEAKCPYNKLPIPCSSATIWRFKFCCGLWYGQQRKTGLLTMTVLGVVRCTTVSCPSHRGLNLIGLIGLLCERTLAMSLSVSLCLILWHGQLSSIILPDALDKLSNHVEISFQIAVHKISSLSESGWSFPILLSVPTNTRSLLQFWISVRKNCWFGSSRIPW